MPGFVFALAGYFAHDVYEKVPFMLLDSLEAIDAVRIAIWSNLVRMCGMLRVGRRPELLKLAERDGSEPLEIVDDVV